MNKPSLVPTSTTIIEYNLIYSGFFFSQWIETDIYLVQLMSEVANRHVCVYSVYSGGVERITV